MSTQFLLALPCSELVHTIFSCACMRRACLLTQFLLRVKSRKKFACSCMRRGRAHNFCLRRCHAKKNLLVIVCGDLVHKIFACTCITHNFCLRRGRAKKLDWTCMQRERVHVHNFCVRLHSAYLRTQFLFVVRSCKKNCLSCMSDVRSLTQNFAWPGLSRSRSKNFLVIVCMRRGHAYNFPNTKRVITTEYEVGDLGCKIQWSLMHTYNPGIVTHDKTQ